jgi:hypothetical protein
LPFFIAFDSIDAKSQTEEILTAFSAIGERRERGAGKSRGAAISDAVALMRRGNPNEVAALTAAILTIAVPR